MVEYLQLALKMTILLYQTRSQMETTRLGVERHADKLLPKGRYQSKRSGDAVKNWLRGESHLCLLQLRVHLLDVMTRPFNGG